MKTIPLTHCKVEATVHSATLPLKDLAEVAPLFYQNPLGITGIGDPFILPADGKYYMYSTNGNTCFEAFSTDTLSKWQQEDKFTALEHAPWGSSKHWAPEVYTYGGRYVILYSCVKAGPKEAYHHVLGIGFADTPEGPFIPSENPLLDLGFSIIDASLFVDDDGTPYLYYARDCSQNLVDGVYRSYIYGARLSTNLLTLLEEPTLLLAPSQSWEYTSMNQNKLWNEGPNVRKHNDKYYLFYSANCFSSKNYGVGVAVSSTPLGPFEKDARNPILTYAEDKVGDVLVSGPGHNSFFTIGAEVFSSYHVHTIRTAPSGNRQLAYDRSGYHADGTAYIAGPTTASWQLLPLRDIGMRNAIQDAIGPELLKDGDPCVSPASQAYVWHGQQADFTWKTPCMAELIQLYPAEGCILKGTITLNDEYILPFDFADLENVPGASVILPLRNPLELHSLRITLDDNGTIGEVIVLESVN